MKLEPEVLGDEAEGSVFGRANLVPTKVAGRVALRVAGVVGQGDVEEDAATDGLAVGGRVGRRMVGGSVERAFGGLLVGGCLPPMEAVEYLLTLAIGLVARRPLGGPSDPLDGLGSIADHGEVEGRQWRSLQRRRREA